MYMREMGTVELLTREGEIDIAKRIEEGALNTILEGEPWFPEGISLDDAPGDNIADRLASLTPQQFKVLTMLSEGMLNKQIAYELAVSEATIKAHVTAIFRKLNVKNRTQAVIALSQTE